MSEEKGGVVETGIYILLIFCMLGVVWFVCTGLLAQSDQFETKTLTILHAWEEGGQYYFADELGCVYLIGCEKDFWEHPQEEIWYDDMPKIRFDKLEEGHRYNVEYVVRRGNVRLSLNEKEMVR